MATTNGTTVYVLKRPKCDFCPDTAYYDGKTAYGSWANMCEMHFHAYGVGLGTGRGQKLLVGKPKPKAAKKTPSIATMERWMESGIAHATDGCRVEPDGTCEHGKPSWLLELGLI